MSGMFMNIYKPKGEGREWKSVSMSLQLDADINYLLEKEIWVHGGTKQKIVKKILSVTFKDSALLRQVLSQDGDC